MRSAVSTGESVLQEIVSGDEGNATYSLSLSNEGRLEGEVKCDSSPGQYNLRHINSHAGMEWASLDSNYGSIDHYQRSSDGLELLGSLGALTCSESNLESLKDRSSWHNRPGPVLTTLNPFSSPDFALLSTVSSQDDRAREHVQLRMQQKWRFPRLCQV